MRILRAGGRLVVVAIEYVRRDGRFIAYRVEGVGPPELLYLHAMPVAIDVIDDEPHVARLFRRLAGIGRLTFYDMPGIGLSDDQPGAYVIEELVADAVAVLDGIGVDRACVVADGGNCIAMRLAALAPERVQALVLIDATARATSTHDYPYGYAEALVRDYVDRSAEPGEGWVARGADAQMWLAPSLADDPSYRDWVERMLRRGSSPRAVRRLLELVSFSDVRSSLPDITAPTLVLGRRDNRFIPIVHSRYLAEHIDGARLVELPGSDHQTYAGDVDALMDEIEDFLTGRRTGSSDRVFATVLFSDIVASTRQAVALGDIEWRSRLDAHDAMIRRELLRYGGHEINTTGDGFIASFDLPTQAVRCARAIATTAAASGIDVRLGLHAGECERRGDDLAGFAVNLAARVADAGGAGDVYVSRTVRDLVIGAEFTFIDRGTFDLKGIPEPWTLYSLNCR
jgi:class 3 adenylate cyclase